MFSGKTSTHLGNTGIVAVNPSPMGKRQPAYDAGIPATGAKITRVAGLRLLYGPFKRVSPYGLFFTENHSEIRKSNPSAAFGEISKMVGAMWRGSTEDVKKSYRHRVRAAKEFYIKAMEAVPKLPMLKFELKLSSDNGDFLETINKLIKVFI